MLENEADPATTGVNADTAATEETPGQHTERSARPRRRAASRPAGPPPEIEDVPAVVTVPAEPAPSAAAPEPGVTSEDAEALEDEESEALEPAESPAAETSRDAVQSADTSASSGAPESDGASDTAPEAVAESDTGGSTSAKVSAGASEPGEGADPAAAVGAEAAGSESAGTSDAGKPARSGRTRSRRGASAAAGSGGRPEVPGVPGVPEAESAPEAAGPGDRGVPGVPVVPEAPVVEPMSVTGGGVPSVTFQPPMVVFQPPQPTKAKAEPKARQIPALDDDEAEDIEPIDLDADEGEDEDGGDRQSRRRRRRGGRGRGKNAKDTDTESGDEDAAAEGEAAETAGEADTAGSGKTGRGSRGKGGKSAKAEKAEKPEKTVAAEGDEAPAAAESAAQAADEDDDSDSAGGTRRRRRRRRRSGSGDGDTAQAPDDPPNTVVHVRDARTVEDEVQSVKGSTRLEAKKQRRREGREQGRRRPPIITESEFLARRESVERVMVIRQQGERTQIAVLEDNVLVEHYVDRATHQSYVGNVYLGKVQNVLPSMEAAFVDIGKGRNAVLYAGEVNWDVAGLVGQPRRIESALKSGQSVLVQVTKDPLGHKGARLTSQISLPGRYLVYVPDGSMTGISRKLPDKERSRLKQILKKIMPENAGVIVRTAAEGATEEELAGDVSRLAAQWENIQRQSKTASAPALLYGEPDLTIRVVRDIFNEDFSKLVVSGEQPWNMVSEYVQYVAPHLGDRVERWEPDEAGQDVLGAFRIDEQIAKALERKVWLPSGGSLVIDRTEAMTVIDVNTGKFTGQGGNLEQTVTRNNLEAAEEIVRQLRLRDIGGIIVIDFIDMVLEGNRELVLRRLLECLSRDRTKHQVAEVTSLGLVQMTRKRVGQGLLEAFSEVCECCNGRGIHIQLNPAEPKPDKNAAPGGRRRKRKGEVERAVEDKLARHDADRAEQSTEPIDAPAAAAADQPTAASADLAVPAETGTTDTAADADTGTNPGADADVATATEATDDAAVASNGRRRRARRTRAKTEPAEVAPE